MRASPPFFFGAALLAGILACPTVYSAPHSGEPWTLRLDGGVRLDMIWIAPGRFSMGSSNSETPRDTDEGPQVTVTLSHGFWLGMTPVTIGQWMAVTGLDVRGQLRKILDDDTLQDFAGRKQTVRDFMHVSKNADPADYLANENADLPMYFVSWNDAMDFCRRLNARERAAGRLPARYEYTLPTEAQWEYAARAGTAAATYAGPPIMQDGRATVLDNIAWYEGNSGESYIGRGFAVAGRTAGPRPVARKQPNAWGFYDMLGNIWQWCWDWYGPYAGGSTTDPAGPANGTERVNRGGSFGSSARDERSANRAGNPPGEASAYRGFRLALSNTG
jgi:formylglycine-generating enzyme required for sulfatase activity